MSDSFVIVEAPRPAEGSPEDLAHRRRVAELYRALDRVGENIIPGSPDLEDELRARRDFATYVLNGLTVDSALSAARMKWEICRIARYLQTDDREEDVDG